MLNQSVLLFLSVLGAAGAAERSVPAWRSADYKTHKPTIGILAQRCHDCPGRSYIAAGFTKWIESAGARAVPIRFYSSEAELRRLFNSVNGLIFPGGLTDLYMDDPYVIAARKLWTWARETNDGGDPFPIWGTCLGFQLLHILESNVSFTQLLVDTDSVAQPTTLDFTDKASSSYMFSSMDKDLVEKLSNPERNIALQNHMFGLPPDHYNTWPVLRENFDILTTSIDRQGVEYVSSAEHRQYPFLATQWHPEKPPFEFGMAEVPHSLDAIRVSQHLANQFVDAARRSSHAFASPEEELNDLIYNYKLWFTLKDSLMEPSYDGPDLTIFFDNPDDEPPYGPDDAARERNDDDNVVTDTVRFMRSRGDGGMHLIGKRKWFAV
jgi:gamma-glutamyl hydrolase